MVVIRQESNASNLLAHVVIHYTARRASVKPYAGRHQCIVGVALTFQFILSFGSKAAKLTR